MECLLFFVRVADGRSGDDDAPREGKSNFLRFVSLKKL